MKDSEHKKKQELKRLSERLEKAIGSNSVRSFSLKCGISDRIVRRYLAAEAEPTFSKLVAMSEAAGVSVQWLMTGEEPNDVQVDKEALIGAFEVVEWAIKEADLDLTTERKSQLLAAVYRLCLASNEKKADRGVIIEMLRSVA